MLKNRKVVLFLSPERVGQAGNFWTLLRIWGQAKRDDPVFLEAKGFYEQKLVVKN